MNSKNQSDEEPKLDGKILMAEDDKPSREAMARILEISGFVVETASDGEIALRKFNEMKSTPQPYSLVIADDQMPRVTGRELARRIREAEASVPFIIMTGFGGSGFEEEVAQLGCEAILYKPIETEELISLVRKLLAENSGLEGSAGDGDRCSGKLPQ